MTTHDQNEQPQSKCQIELKPHVQLDFDTCSWLVLIPPHLLFKLLDVPHMKRYITMCQALAFSLQLSWRCCRSRQPVPFIPFPPLGPKLQHTNSTWEEWRAKTLKETDYSVVSWVQRILHLCQSCPPDLHRVWVGCLVGRGSSRPIPILCLLILRKLGNESPDSRRPN